MFEERRGTPIERAVDGLLFLLSGRADALSGRHIDVDDDQTDLLKRSGEIQQADLYTLRRRT